MKRILLGALLFPLFADAQWNVNVFGGFANYFGDLQSSPYTTQQAHLAGGLGLQYDLTQHFSVLSNLTFGKVGASDEYSPQADLQARNLSFTTDISELNLLAEYNILSLRSHKITPYVYAGVAVYHFNPYAYDSTGKKVYLRPLSTEGEGLPQYPNVHEYALTQLAIPFGGGIKFRISDQVVLAYDIGMRKLFTDYLDDVSGRYVDQSTLLADKGPEAVEMAYRGNEIKGGAGYPPAGTVRGDPRRKDWYYFSGLRVIIAFNTRPMEEHRRQRSILDCPKKVY
ncbi:MAG TPA: DUF6089 family protein [Puia sp.]|nr:DUF6089 family protein [Puia sp.]